MSWKRRESLSGNCTRRMKRSRKSSSLTLENVLFDTESEYESQQIDPLSFPLEVQLEEDFMSSNEDDKSQIVPSVPDSDDDDGGFACELCGRRFPNITGLKTHKRSHKDDVVNPGQALYKSRQYSLHEYEEKEAEYAGFTCGICKRCFPNIYGLRTHERFHGHTPCEGEDHDRTSKQKLILPKMKCFLLTKETVSKTKHRDANLAQVEETRRSTARLNPRPIRPKVALSRASPNSSENPVKLFKYESQPQQVKTNQRSLPRDRTDKPDGPNPRALPTMQDKSVLYLNSNHGPEDTFESRALESERAHEGNQFSFSVSYEKGHGTNSSALQEYPIFAKTGMFYLCTLCDHRNLHINGIRSHWNRHVREERESLKTS